MLLGLLHDLIPHWSPWSLGENATTLWPWGHLWSRLRWIPGMQLSWSYGHETKKPWSKLHTMNISKKRVWMHLNPTIIIWLPIVETPILSGLVALTILKNMSSWMGRINYPIYEMENKKCMKPPTSFQGICRSRRFRVPPTRAQRQRRAGRAGRGVGGEVLELLGQSLRLADTLLTHRYTQIYIYIYLCVFMYHEMSTNTYIYMYI